MAAYTSDTLSFHQRNMLFILFARDLEDSIEYFFTIKHSNALGRICGSGEDYLGKLFASSFI